MKSSRDAPYLLLKLTLILLEIRSSLCCFLQSQVLITQPERHQEATSPLSLVDHLGSQQDQAPVLSETHCVFIALVDLCNLIPIF